MDIGILWDYNGVLVLDEHLHKKAFISVLARFRIPNETLLPALEKYCTGRRDADCVSDIRKEFPEQLARISQEELSRQKVKEFIRLASTEDLLVPNVERILETFSKMSTMGLVTGALARELDRVFGPRNLYRYFKTIVTGENVTHGKPDPEAYEKGREALGMPAQQIVVIEDSPAGIKSAHRAGLRCIAVAHTFPKEKLSAADLVLPALADLQPEHITHLVSTKRP